MTTREDADRERYELQRSHFETALARLEDALAVDENEFVRDAIVQRFEFTFEMAWKKLFRYLVLRGERVAAKAWDVLPVAFEAKLIGDPDAWKRLREYRNDTSHEYDRRKALEVVAFVRTEGVTALRALRDEMRGRG